MVHEAPAGMVDILQILTTAAIVTTIAIDRERTEPGWMISLKVLVLICCIWILLSSRQWYVPKRIGGPVHTGTDLIIVAAAIVLVFKAVRRWTGRATTDRQGIMTNPNERVGEDAV